jgi:predicted transcriptional regulator
MYTHRVDELRRTERHIDILEALVRQSPFGCSNWKVLADRRVCVSLAVGRLTSKREASTTGFEIH